MQVKVNENTSIDKQRKGRQFHDIMSSSKYDLAYPSEVQQIYNGIWQHCLPVQLLQGVLQLLPASALAQHIPDLEDTQMLKTLGGCCK